MLKLSILLNMENFIIGIISSVFAALILTFMSYAYRMMRARQTMITSVKLESTPFFKNNSIINLNKINYMYGENAIGKTAFADWISTLGNSDRILEWKLKENYFPIC